LSRTKPAGQPDVVNDSLSCDPQKSSTMDSSEADREEESDDHKLELSRDDEWREEDEPEEEDG